MGQEMRRAFGMTFNQENFAGMARGKSSLGWLADPHLRKGMLFAVPVLFGGFVGLIALMPMRMLRMTVREFALLLLLSLLANLVWFGVAAASRARAERNGLDGP